MTILKKILFIITFVTMGKPCTITASWTDWFSFGAIKEKAKQNQIVTAILATVVATPFWVLLYTKMKSKPTHPVAEPDTKMKSKPTHPVAESENKPGSALGILAGLSKIQVKAPKVNPVETNTNAPGSIPDELSPQEMSGAKTPDHAKQDHTVDSYISSLLLRENEERKTLKTAIELSSAPALAGYYNSGILYFDPRGNLCGFPDSAPLQFGQGNKIEPFSAEEKEKFKQCLQQSEFIAYFARFSLHNPSQKMFEILSKEYSWITPADVLFCYRVKLDKNPNGCNKFDIFFEKSKPFIPLKILLQAMKKRKDKLQSIKKQDDAPGTSLPVNVLINGERKIINIQGTNEDLAKNIDISLKYFYDGGSVLGLINSPFDSDEQVKEQVSWLLEQNLIRPKEIPVKIRDDNYYQELKKRYEARKRRKNSQSIGGFFSALQKGFAERGSNHRGLTYVDMNIDTVGSEQKTSAPKKADSNWFSTKVEGLVTSVFSVLKVSKPKLLMLEEPKTNERKEFDKHQADSIIESEQKTSALPKADSNWFSTNVEYFVTSVSRVFKASKKPKLLMLEEPEESSKKEFELLVEYFKVNERLPAKVAFDTCFTIKDEQQGALLAVHKEKYDEYKQLLEEIRGE